MITIHFATALTLLQPRWLTRTYTEGANAHPQDGKVDHESQAYVHAALTRNPNLAAITFCHVSQFIYSNGC